MQLLLHLCNIELRVFELNHTQISQPNTVVERNVVYLLGNTVLFISLHLLECIYRIFRTISRTFFHSLAGPATYTQVRLIYIKIYNFTCS